jgi:hypothetical protein
MDDQRAHDAVSSIVAALALAVRLRDFDDQASDYREARHLAIALVDHLNTALENLLRDRLEARGIDFRSCSSADLLAMLEDD